MNKKILLIVSSCVLCLAGCSKIDKSGLAKKDIEISWNNGVVTYGDVALDNCYISNREYIVYTDLFEVKVFPCQNYKTCEHNYIEYIEQAYKDYKGGTYQAIYNDEAWDIRFYKDGYEASVYLPIESVGDTFDYESDVVDTLVNIIDLGSISTNLKEIDINDEIQIKVDPSNNFEVSPESVYYDGMTIYVNDENGWTPEEDVVVCDKSMGFRETSMYDLYFYGDLVFQFSNINKHNLEDYVSFKEVK